MPAPYAPAHSCGVISCGGTCRSIITTAEFGLRATTGVCNLCSAESQNRCRFDLPAAVAAFLMETIAKTPMCAVYNGLSCIALDNTSILKAPANQELTAARLWRRSCEGGRERRCGVTKPLHPTLCKTVVLSSLRRKQLHFRESWNSNRDGCLERAAPNWATGCDLTAQCHCPMTHHHHHQTPIQGPMTVLQELEV